MLSFLETQGEVHVLSSPRISSINNQKAILKIGDDEQFVTGFATGQNTNTTTVTGGGTVIAPPTPVYSTYFSGISLDVTPQIDDDDNIVLHVHPMISDVTTKSKPTGSGDLPFAVNKISETDSVVKAKDGQIVVIGGLMSESYEDTRNKVPVAGDVNGGIKKIKRELVILLKPTIVRGDNVWTDDISAMQQRVESFGKEAKPAVR